MKRRLSINGVNNDPIMISQQFPARNENYYIVTKVLSRPCYYFSWQPRTPTISTRITFDMDSFGNGGPLGKQEKDFATDDIVLQHTENTNDQMFSNVDEKKVLRKMDIRLIPVLALLYLLSFLDVSPLSLRTRIKYANSDAYSVETLAMPKFKVSPRTFI
jgi:hypothetical protein